MERGKRYEPEEVVNLLRQIEVAITNGKTTAMSIPVASRKRGTNCNRPASKGITAPSRAAKALRADG